MPSLAPSQNLLAKLEPLRDRLIDTTLRNRLLNYKDSGGKNLRFLRIDLSELYTRLVNGGKEFEIRGSAITNERGVIHPPASVPSPLDETGDDCTAELRRGKLFAPDSPKRTDSRLAALNAQYKNCLEALGTNLLYVACGFLEWSDPARKGAEKLHAPLVLVPVHLTRTARQVESAEFFNDEPGMSQQTTEVRPVRTYKYTLSHDGEDVIDNVALRLKLARHPFNAQWPEFDAEEEDGINKYFRHIELLLRSLPPDLAQGWRIVKAARLAFFSSAKEAMHRDLDYTKWPTTGLVGNEWVAASLAGRERGNSPPVTDDEVTLAMHKDPIPTVVDADSSQMRTLIRIKRGDSLVVQGPPGTGKSQTITNIIAEAMSGGKSVLFMSEKMAALAVVRARLEKAGLGPYCLELHSSKATPKEVLAQVKARLHHIPPAAESSSTSWNRLSLLNGHRIALANYGDALRHSLPSLEQTFLEGIWEEANARDAVEAAAPGLAPRVPPLKSGTIPTPLVLAQLKDALRTAARLVADGVYSRAVAWHGVSPRQFPGEAVSAAIKRALMASLNAAQQWQAALNDLPCADSWPEETGTYYNRWAAGLGLPEVSNLPSVIMRRLVEEPESAAAYQDYLAKMRIWRNCESAFVRRWAETETISDVHLREAEAAAGQALEAALARVLGDSWGTLRERTAALQATVAALNDRVAHGHRLAELFTQSAPPAILSQCSRQGHLAGKLAVLTVQIWRALHPAILRPAAIQEFTSAKAKADIFVRTRQLLDRKVCLDRLPDDTAVRSLIETVRSSRHSFLRHIPGSKARRARLDLYALMRQSSKQLSEVDALSALKSALEWRRASGAFDECSDLQVSLGGGFAGLKTDWGVLEEAFATAHLLLEVLGAEASVRIIENKDTLAAKSTVLHELASKIAEADEILVQNLPVFTGQPLAQLREMAADTISRDLSALQNRCLGICSALEPLGLTPSDRLDAIAALCVQARQLRDSKRRIDLLTADQGFLGSLHQGLLTTDLTAIEPGLAWANAVTNRQDLPGEVRRWLMEANSLSRAAELEGKLQTVVKTVIQTQATMAQLELTCEIESATASLSAHLDRTAGEAVQALEQALDTLACLPEWYQLREAERSIEALDAIEFWHWAKTALLSAEVTVLAANLGFWRQHLENFSNLHPEALNHHRVRLEQHGSEFQALDRASGNASAKLVNCRAYRKQSEIPAGQNSGSVKTWTEMALLHHEISKQRSHITVRRLVRQAGTALRQMMPCWMMGPQAIAQFIEPEAFAFDLLVIDEASQVRPEDALGALARAKQVVIVGDSRQMPPSNVFMALGDLPDDESEDDAIEGQEKLDKTSAALELESILDTLEGQLPSEKLLWHYRSLHHSLIAFSNESFYDRELVIPPSRWHDNPRLGVRWHFVENGRLQARKNPAEAEQIIQLMAEHVRAAAHLPEAERESLGVVAMNAPQQDHLREQWENLCRHDPELDDARAEFEKAEPLFIRNLENVQGDERDVIIVSVTYDSSSQRFGLINQAGGQRRLNVLFTRARRRLHVFSSLKASDVMAEMTQSDSGKTALRRYLHFAETGVLPDSGLAKVRESPESPFEESVARAIKGLGLDLHFQVGVSGFRVDIGVMHPHRPGEYLCGIECDGATYHSHPIARDRDRIRQELLKARGWKIYRIWSTDWYRSRAGEIERLRLHLQSLIAGRP